MIRALVLLNCAPETILLRAKPAGRQTVLKENV